MPFKSTLARSAGKLFGVFREVDLSLRGKSNISRVIYPFLASGGNADAIEPGNGYAYHTFTGPGTFTVTSCSPESKVELLIVGGGGGGGSPPNGYATGGGGAGGLRNITNIPVSIGPYSIIVGSGTGTGGTSNGASPPSASTSALGYLTHGGGKGTHYQGGGGGGLTAGPGGSGGGHGVSHNFRSETGGTGNIGNFSPPEGNPGGSGPTNGGQGGGGSGGSGSGGTGGAGTTLPDYTGSLVGVPGLSPLNGLYSKGGAPSGPAPINNSGKGANGANPGSPGIAVIRYLR